MTLALTIVGNLTRDPELRFTQSGTAVAGFSIAHNDRKPDGNGGYVDSEPTFMECRAWRDLGEHVAESLTAGTRVIATGFIETQTWEKDGEKRSRLVMTVTGIGPDLRWATAQVKKMSRSHGPDSDEWNSASKERPAGDGEPPF